MRFSLPEKIFFTIINLNLFNSRSVAVFSSTSANRALCLSMKALQAFCLRCPLCSGLTGH